MGCSGCYFPTQGHKCIIAPYEARYILSDEFTVYIPVRALVVQEAPVARVHPKAKKWRRFFTGVY